MAYLTKTLILILLFTLSCSFHSETEKNQEETLVYSAIIDSVFNDSLIYIFVEDSTHSLVRYITKNTFSEELFGKDPEQYFIDLFNEKNSDINQSLIKAYIENNRHDLYLADTLKINRINEFVPFMDIYAYRLGYKIRKSHITQKIRAGEKIGIISFSRVGFNRNLDECLLEVSVHLGKRSENFFLNLKKNNGTWQQKAHCYIYGPYKK